ncbi:MAG: Hpt domain-containing protein [Selenomonadaceae bacterium]|nr:Hpt domain-containing protein [Selenomonadaceae bacterium]
MSALTEKLAERGCNIAEAMGRFMDNEPFYERCFTKYLADSSFDALGEALAAKDVKAAFEAAHNLKGVSANMGITPVNDIVNDLVEELRAGNLPDDALERHSKIVAIRDEIASYI